MDKILYTIALIVVALSIILSPTTTAVSLSGNDGYTIPVNAAFDGCGRLVSVSFENNGTHLNIYLLFDGTLPNSSSNSISVVRYFSVYIDLDNNPLTGDKSHGGEVSYSLGVSSLGLRPSFREYLYLGNGTMYSNNQVNEYVRVSDNSPYVNISIPLSRLNLTSDSVFAAVYSTQNNYIYDYLSEDGSPVIVENASIPIATITVDGDPSDWHGLAPIPPLIVDSGDPFEIPYQDLNVTAFYVAKDNQYLYLRLDFNDKYSVDKYRGNHTYGYARVYIQLDTNNDGENDYSLLLYRDSSIIRIFNASEKRWHSYYMQRQEYLMRESGDGILEYGIPLEYIGSPSNDNMTVTFSYTLGNIYNNVIVAYYNAYLDPKYTGSRLVHLGDNNWIYSEIVYRRGGKGGPGVLSVDLLNASVETVFTSETGYMFANVLGDPTGAAIGNYLKDFLIIRVNDSTILDGPIRITYRYSNETLQLAGIDAGHLRPYVYDWDNGEYLPVGKVINIPSMNTLIFSIDPIGYRGTYYLVIGFFESSEPTAGAATTVTTTLTRTNTITVTETVTETNVLTTTVTVSGGTTIRPTTITETNIITTTLLERITTTITTSEPVATQTLTETIEKTITIPTTVTETTGLPGQTVTITQTTETLGGINPALTYALIAIIALLVIVIAVVLRKK